MKADEMASLSAKLSSLEKKPKPDNKGLLEEGPPFPASPKLWEGGLAWVGAGGAWPGEAWAGGAWPGVAAGNREPSLLGLVL